MTYISFIYVPTTTTVTSITGIIQTFAPATVASFSITPVTQTTQLVPHIFQYNFPTPITTNSVRALQMAVNIVNSGGISPVYIYGITLGFNSA